MKVFFKPKVLEKAMPEVDGIHNTDEDEEQQRCAEHHDHFHELAVDQPSVLPAAKDTIQDKTRRAECRAADEKKRDEAEEAEQASPCNNVRDEFIEEVL